MCIRDSNWLIAALVFLMGVTIRHYFNTMHARKGDLWWTWAVTAILFIAIMFLSSLGLRQVPLEEAEARALTPTEQRFAAAEGFDDVTNYVMGRCSMCHAREPFYEGIYHAPKGVFLETPGDIARAAREIYLQAGVTDAMPPANVSFMEDAERDAIIRWYRAATGLEIAAASP